MIYRKKYSGSILFPMLLSAILIITLESLYSQDNKTPEKGNYPIRIRTGTILNAELSMHNYKIINKPELDDEISFSQYLPTKRFSYYVGVQMKLDKGRSLSIYDYDILDKNGRAFRCEAIQSGDGPFNAQPEIKDCEGSKACTLLFPVQSPFGMSPYKYKLRYKLLIDNKMPSETLTVKNIDNRPFSSNQVPAAKADKSTESPSDKSSAEKDSTQSKIGKKSITKENIELWLKFKGSYNDSSGNNRNVSNDNTSASITDSGTLSLPGDGYIKINNFKYGNGKNFTLSMWFKSMSTNSISEYKFLFSHGSKITEPNNLNIVLGGNQASFFKNKIRTMYNDSDDNFAIGYKNPKINNTEFDIDLNTYSNGEWHLLALVADDSNGTTLYVDGKKIGNQPNRGTDIFSPSGPLVIGTKSDFKKDRFFKGEIDDIRIFNRSLSAKQIRSLYSKGRK